jgi:hypothetical protein
MATLTVWGDFADMILKKTISFAGSPYYILSVRLPPGFECLQELSIC